MLLPWKRCSGDFSCSLANGSYDPMSLHRNLRKTLIKNLELLHAHQSELASHDCIRYVEQSVAHLTNNLAQLRKDSENNPTRNNIVEVMKFLFNDNDERTNGRTNGQSFQTFDSDVSHYLSLHGCACSYTICTRVHRCFAARKWNRRQFQEKQKHPVHGRFSPRSARSADRRPKACRRGC